MGEIALPIRRVPEPPLTRPLSSDERLARLVSRGSERAFATLYERHHQALYRYARSIVRDDDDALDALQSAMTRAFAALRKTERDVAVRPWLFRIVHNESVSILRRRRLGDRTLEEDEPADFDVERTAAQRERLTTLVADLHSLAERQRAALVMRELSGLSIEEIAAALSTSPGAAKQALFEARGALHEIAEGRAMACEAARRSISERDGRVLRGRKLRAHLRACEGCREFRAAIDTRSADLRALAPPLPAAAAGTVLAHLLAGGAGGHGGAAGLAGGTAAAAGTAAAVGSAGAGGGAGIGAAIGLGGGAAGSLAVKALAGAVILAATAAGTARIALEPGKPAGSSAPPHGAPARASAPHAERSGAISVDPGRAIRKASAGRLATHGPAASHAGAQAGHDGSHRRGRGRFDGGAVSSAPSLADGRADGRGRENVTRGENVTESRGGEAGRQGPSGHGEEPATGGGRDGTDTGAGTRHGGSKGSGGQPAAVTPVQATRSGDGGGRGSSGGPDEQAQQPTAESPAPTDDSDGPTR